MGEERKQKRISSPLLCTSSSSLDSTILSSKKARKLLTRIKKLDEDTKELKSRNNTLSCSASSMSGSFNFASSSSWFHYDLSGGAEFYFPGSKNKRSLLHEQNLDHTENKTPETIPNAVRVDSGSNTDSVSNTSSSAKMDSSTAPGLTTSVRKITRKRLAGDNILALQKPQEFEIRWKVHGDCPELRDELQKEFSEKHSPFFSLAQ